MKKHFSTLSVFVLALVALATQSCESTDDQNTYYNHRHSGYYRDGRYAEDNGYYHEGHYESQSVGPPAIEVHLRPDYIQ